MTSLLRSEGDRAPMMGFNNSFGAMCSSHRPIYKHIAKCQF